MLVAMPPAVISPASAPHFRYGHRQPSIRGNSAGLHRARQDRPQLSLAGPVPAEVAKTALDAAVVAGIPVVISAGNDGGRSRPRQLRHVSGGTGIIPVGATENNDNIASFSSRGPSPG